MTTATMEQQADQLKAAKNAKLRHAFWLEKQVRKAIREKPELWSLLLGPVEFAADGVDASTLLKALARRWEISDTPSLADYTPVETARLCAELRKFLTEAGVKLPRAGRKQRGESLGELIAVILDEAAALGWSQEQLDRFVVHQLERKYGARAIETLGHAKAVLGGLKGIARHREGGAR